MPDPPIAPPPAPEPDPPAPEPTPADPAPVQDPPIGPELTTVRGSVTDCSGSVCLDGQALVLDPSEQEALAGLLGATVSLDVEKTTDGWIVQTINN